MTACFTGLWEYGYHPCLRIVAFVADQGRCLERWHQSIGSFQIARLPSGEVKTRGVAQRIHRRMNLRAQSPLASSYRLGTVFFRAPALC